LSAETELQRAAAIANASGVVSAMVVNWRDAVLRLSAQVEAALDFSDEDDVDELPEGFTWNIAQLRNELADWLERPRSEKLGEGFRIALAGPPNAGKSTLFNALVESEAAITSPIAGTTRDVIERNVAIDGVPFSFVDTAGLREDGADDIEAIGIDRAHAELEKADVVLWLGEEGAGPKDAWEIATRKDADSFISKASARFELSGATGDGVDQLKSALVDHARAKLPKPGEGALNSRQHALLKQASAALQVCEAQSDLLLIGEDLRVARACFDRLIGRSTTEDMLDALFGRFCIGK
ncbi:MAG: GTPase, partial [Erythrobacter sp.]